MMNKKEYIREQKDCAKMLGISLKEYRTDLKNTTAPKKEKDSKNIKYDNSFLKLFNASELDLKKKY